MNSESRKIDDKQDDETVGKKEIEKIDENKDIEEANRPRKVIRIPMKRFLRDKLKVVVGALIMLILILFIINLSRMINPDPDRLNPTNILILDTNTAIILTFISSLLFIIVLMAFTKSIFFDKKDDFGIEKFKSPRSIWFFLLTISFISQIYILLDTAMINVYLITGPIYILQWVNNYIPIPYLSLGADREAYASNRALIFTSLLVFNLIFPVFMSISIFTRYGRKNLRKATTVNKDKRYSFKKFILFILMMPVMILLFAGFVSLIDYNSLIANLMLILMLMIFLWWLLQLFIIFFKAVRITMLLSYSNISMIIPIIFTFYALPAIIWALWDISVMITTGSIVNTIYDFEFMASTAVPYSGNISELSAQQLFEVFISTVFYNSQSFIRIIQLDFIFIIGIASIVIGFAEGYTIFALIKSVKTGLSISKTGRVAKQSAPRLVVMTKNILLFFTWLSLLWDKFVGFWQYLISQFSLDLPAISFPVIFEPIFYLSTELLSLNEIFLPLAILLIPFYFIIMSSFKFLSVSIAADKTKDDNQIFFLLISSAFILIITQIYSDIASLPSFIGSQNRFLPLKILSNQNMLSFILKITDLLETVGFFTGFIASLFYIFKKYVVKK